MKIVTLMLFSMMMMSPSATLFSSPFQKDKPAEVDRAEQALRTAKGELEHAGGEWGGHRVLAMKHIAAALHELEGGGTVGTRASRHQVRFAASSH